MRDLDRANCNARENQYSEAVAGAVRLQLTYRRLRTLLSTLPTDAIALELGCGPEARLSELLSQSVGTVVGLDPNVDNHVTGSGIRLVRGALGSDPLAHTTGVTHFDLVTAIHVLEHIPDIRQGLQGIHLALSEGGRFYALTPAGDSSQLQTFGAAWWMLEDPTHIRFFSAKSLTLALQQAGFRSVRVRRLTLDSLGTESASLIRQLRPRQRPSGVLESGVFTALAAAGLPLSVALRVTSPNFRPVLEVAAEA